MRISEKSNRCKQSSFFVRVRFRQNVSWQGEVQWMEGEKTKSFRSLLELIMLMHGAMEEGESPQTDSKLRSWTEKDR